MPEESSKDADNIVTRAPLKIIHTFTIAAARGNASSIYHLLSGPVRRSSNCLILNGRYTLLLITGHGLNDIGEFSIAIVSRESI